MLHRRIMIEAYVFRFYNRNYMNNTNPIKNKDGLQIDKQFLLH